MVGTCRVGCAAVVGGLAHAAVGERDCVVDPLVTMVDRPGEAAAVVVARVYGCAAVAVVALVTTVGRVVAAVVVAVVRAAPYVVVAPAVVRVYGCAEVVIVAPAVVRAAP